MKNNIDVIYDYTRACGCGNVVVKNLTILTAQVGVVLGLFSNLENIQALFSPDQYKDEK